MAKPKYTVEYVNGSGYHILKDGMFVSLDPNFATGKEILAILQSHEKMYQALKLLRDDFTGDTWEELKGVLKAKERKQILDALTSYESKLK